VVASLISDVFSPARCPRLIVKIGSALLVDKAGRIRRDWLETVVSDVSERRAKGQQVAIVSSGAIALGARVLGLPKGGRASLEDAQAAAATGQIGLSSAWAELLHAKKLVAAQMLVTLDDLEDRRRYLNASATLARLLALDVVPIINENDSVATTEIRFGDNDRLAARIAQAAGAQGVILLSDVAGLYTANPGVDPDAKLVPEVRTIDARIRAMADGGSASGMGSGGMVAKLLAARIAQGSGANLAIVSGREDHPLARFAETGFGTLFWGGEGKKGRKAWLAGRLTARGRIIVDAGAAKALLDGRSLLAAGATGVEGAFARGDVVDISDADGTILARGLAEYDASDAAKIVGHRSDAHGDLLGYAPRSAMVHRDHMVLV
jgi:glutamate 5-kinase